MIIYTYPYRVSKEMGVEMLLFFCNYVSNFFQMEY